MINKLLIQLKWQEFIEFGNDVTENELDQRIKGIAPNKCSTLIYTVSKEPYHWVY